MLKVVFKTNKYKQLRKRKFRSTRAGYIQNILRNNWSMWICIIHLYTADHGLEQCLLRWYYNLHHKIYRYSKIILNAKSSLWEIFTLKNKHQNISELGFGNTMLEIYGFAK